MSLVKEAVFASRQGASCMAKRDYTGSIAAFRQALESLQAMVNSGLEAHSLQSWRLTTMPLAHTTTEQQESDSCNLFRQCFLIMPMPCHEKVPTTDKLALFSAALLFNTALAYHLGASSDMKSQSEHTMSLYQQAGKILNQGLDDTSDGAALMLAVSNNMASLALERFDMPAFFRHRQNLGSYLSLTTATTGAFYAEFFAGNFVATDVAHRRGAAAA